LPNLAYLGLFALIALLQACSHLPLEEQSVSGLSEEDKKEAHISRAPRKTTPSLAHTSDEIAREEAETEEESDELSADLWPHLRQGFGLLPKTYNEPTQEFIRYYSKASRTVQRMLENAQPYLAYVTAEVEKRGMPLEIALIPMIESHYSPTIYSPQQAAGLWQFIPATGKRYGLAQNWWYDGRRDVAASTKAALDYLEVLYRDLDNDWLKALAAYNCGEVRVKNAVDNNRRNGKGTDYWQLDDLPTETRNYIPRLLAIAAILKKPQRYGIEVAPLPRENTLQVVKSTSQIELDIVARLAGMDATELRRLNPGYIRWATAPEGPHSFLMPTANARAFSEKVVHLSQAERMPMTMSKGSSDTVAHRIGKGESLWQIARRYNTSVQVLSQINNIKKGKTLKVGDTLIVPLARDLTQIAAAPPVAPPTVSSTTPPKSNSTAARSSAVALKTKKPKTTTHKIRAGDTLWKLAQHYDTTVKDLLALNGLSKNTRLRVGHNLKVPARNSRNI
jgi:membrane-bound lytic murein transglycosylase D